MGMHLIQNIGLLWNSITLTISNQQIESNHLNDGNLFGIILFNSEKNIPFLLLNNLFTNVPTYDSNLKNENKMFALVNKNIYDIFCLFATIPLKLSAI